MPFDYQHFETQCQTMTTEDLLQQHKHYAKICTASMTGTAVSALSIPLTFGLSGVGIGLSAPAHHNAKKKKLIVEKYLKARGIEAQQATQYAHALADNQQQQQQQQMWMQQQTWQQENVGQPTRDLKEESPDFKPAQKGNMSPQSPASPPPPPAYHDLGAATPTYPQPPQAYGPPQGAWGQPQAWTQPQMGYGTAQGGWSQSQAPYCSPQATMYPNTAMYSGHPASTVDRHVHFAQ